MKLLVGGFIALTLLGLYIYAVSRALMLVWYPGSGSLTSGDLLALTTIGGLVSALVIAELAITRPGDVPSVSVQAEPGRLSRAATTAAPWVIGLYMIIWAGVGVTAFVVGVMQHPGVVSSLTDLGQSWLGLAVASAYAYFGLNKDEPAPTPTPAEA
jgi:hypothetical protein